MRCDVPRALFSDAAAYSVPVGKAFSGLATPDHARSRGLGGARSPEAGCPAVARRSSPELGPPPRVPGFLEATREARDLLRLGDEGAVDLDGTFSSEIAARPPPLPAGVLAPVPKRREMSDFGMIERFEKTYPTEKPPLPSGPDWARNDRGGWTWKGRAIGVQ